jgi:DNA-binding PadR family transcriptional regulator
VVGRVLALLSAKPTHGYELKSSFEEAVGDRWGGLNIGHLYQVLDRLCRDGLIESERQPQQVKPDRVIHRLTPAGRTELDRWLSEPAIPARGYRDDFFLKIMAAVRSADPATLPAVLSRQRAHLLRQLHALADARATTSTTAVESLRRRGYGCGTSGRSMIRSQEPSGWRRRTWTRTPVLSAERVEVRARSSNLTVGSGVSIPNFTPALAICW